MGKGFLSFVEPARGIPPGRPYGLVPGQGIRVHLERLFPEGAGMVHHAGVAELVRDDVAAQSFRQKDEPRVKIDASL